MPHNVKVIRGSDFIRAKPEGQVDLAMAEKLLKAIADAGAGLEDFDVLVDIRRISGRLKPSELWSLAQTRALLRPVCREPGHERARVHVVRRCNGVADNRRNGLTGEAGMMRLVIAASMLLVAGCGNYYRVSEPASGKEFYTTNIDDAGRGGAIKFKDARTGEVVTLQNSAVKEVSSEEFKKATAAQ
ncbi:MAG TPA: hypothetical protein VJQ58_13205 [Burkholderiales bacterium]|nr:hypothetical protein [Burkholderiales bacterium]